MNDGTEKMGRTGISEQEVGLEKGVGGEKGSVVGEIEWGLYPPVGGGTPQLREAGCHFSMPEREVLVILNRLIN